MLIVYDKEMDMIQFIRLFIMQLRCKLNPYALSIDVIDLINMGRDFVYFAEQGSLKTEADIKARFNVISTKEEMKDAMSKYSIELAKRQRNILVEFKTIEKYNEAMLELESITESYMFMVYFVQDLSDCSDINFQQLLNTGADVGIYPIICISLRNFTKNATNHENLEYFNDIQFLEDGEIKKRAKTFIFDTYFSEDARKKKTF